MKHVKSCLAAAAFPLPARGAAAGCVSITGERPLTPEQARAALVEDYDGAPAVFSGKVVALDAFGVRLKLDKVWKGKLGDGLLMSAPDPADP